VAGCEVDFVRFLNAVAGHGRSMYACVLSMPVGWWISKQQTLQVLPPVKFTSRPS
jgi:hypothetical protein